MKQNHELTEAQENFRRGSTSFHQAKTLAAKAVLKHIKANPGCTKEDIFAAIGDEYKSGAFDVLTKHKLAYSKGQKPALWYPTGTNP
jgi:hypothetical protein